MKYIVPLAILISTNTDASIKKRRLSLEQAIVTAQKQSFQLRKLKLDGEMADLELKRKIYSVYTPTIKLNSSYTSQKTLTERKSADGSAPVAAPTGTSDTSIKKSGEISLTMDSFTIFNSFKDADSVKEAKIDNYIGKLDRKEERRTQIFAIIKGYFGLVFKKKEIETLQNLYSQNKSVYELTLAKLKSGKGKKSDTLFTRNEMLKIKQSLTTKIKEYKKSIQDFNALLSEPLGREYVLTTPFEYRPIAFTNELIRKKLRVAPSVIKAESDLEKSKISLKNSWKEIMPLPSVSVSGFSYGSVLNAEGYSGRKRTFEGGGDGGTKFGLEATISLEIPLWSESGFFNRLNIRRSELEVANSKNALLEAKKNSLKELNQQFIEIKSQETNMIDLRNSYDNSAKLLDQVFQDFMKGKSNHEEIKNAVNDLKDATSELYTAYLEHLNAKMDLATALGLSSLFGDDFYSTQKNIRLRNYRKAKRAKASPKAKSKGKKE